jgi:hypothetical protein
MTPSVRGDTSRAIDKEVSPVGDEYHSHHVEPENSSLAGYAAIKYTAIVIIVLAILAFIAWYVIPAFR